MPTKTKSRGSQCGAALAMAVVITGVCVVIVAGLMQYVISEYRATHLDWRQVQALYCAEAGIEYAMESVVSGGTVTSDEVTMESLGVSGAEGSFKVSTEVVTSGGVDDPDGDVRITATGYVPSEADVLGGQGVSRRVVAVVGTGTWDFGFDAVRSRKGIDFGANTDITIVVDSSHNPITDLTVNASLRVTGEGGTIGAVKSVAANKASVAGTVSAPGNVDLLDGRTRGVSENNPGNYVDDAFPDNATLGYDDSDPPQLIWPPAPGTWVDQYYQEALAGGTVYSASGTIQAPKFIELGGTGELSGCTLRGPGTIFVHGNLGAPLTNGPEPATVVITGNFFTQGNDEYWCHKGSQAVAPPIIAFGDEHEIKGTSEWHLDGPFYSLHPAGEILINDSALGLFGALVSNGTVYFKSSGGTLGFPQSLKDQRFTLRGGRMLRSYAAQ